MKFIRLKQVIHAMDANSCVVLGSPNSIIDMLNSLISHLGNEDKK